MCLGLYLITSSCGFIQFRLLLVAYVPYASYSSYDSYGGAILAAYDLAASLLLFSFSLSLPLLYILFYHLFFNLFFFATFSSFCSLFMLDQIFQDEIGSHLNGSNGFYGGSRLAGFGC